MKTKTSRFAYVSILILLTLILFSTNALFVSAFGISVPYNIDNTIKLEPGQTYELKLLIQNGDNEDIDVIFEYSIDEPIATLREHKTSIPRKTYDTEYIFDIFIPETALPGEKYRLEFRGRPDVKEEGQVPMTIEIKRFVDILVVNEEGIGFKERELGFFEKIWNFIVGIILKIQVPIIIILAVLAVYVIFKKTWNVSKQITKNMDDKNRVHNIKQKITNAKSAEYIMDLIHKMPQSQFEDKKIKTLIAKKLKSLKENFLSKKLLSSKSKKQFIKIIK